MREFLLDNYLNFLFESKITWDEFREDAVKYWDGYGNQKEPEWLVSNQKIVYNNCPKYLDYILGFIMTNDDYLLVSKSTKPITGIVKKTIQHELEVIEHLYNNETRKKDIMNDDVERLITTQDLYKVAILADALTTTCHINEHFRQGIGILDSDPCYNIKQWKEFLWSIFEDSIFCWEILDNQLKTKKSQKEWERLQKKYTILPKNKFGRIAQKTLSNKIKLLKKIKVKQRSK